MVVPPHPHIYPNPQFPTEVMTFFAGEKNEDLFLGEDFFFGGGVSAQNSAPPRKHKAPQCPSTRKKILATPLGLQKNKHKFNDTFHVDCLNLLHKDLLPPHLKNILCSIDV